MYSCQYCLRSNFKSQHGLSQHQSQGVCYVAHLREMSSGPGQMGSAHDNQYSPRRLRSNMVHDQADNWVYIAPDAPTRHKYSPFLQNLDNDALEAIRIEMGGHYG